MFLKKFPTADEKIADHAKFMSVCGRGTGQIIIEDENNTNTYTIIRAFITVVDDIWSDGTTYTKGLGDGIAEGYG